MSWSRVPVFSGVVQGVTVSSGIKSGTDYINRHINNILTKAQHTQYNLWGLIKNKSSSDRERF